MFAFIFVLFNFMTFYVVDESGAGAGGDNDQGGDNGDDNGGAAGEEGDVGDVDLGDDAANESESPLNAEETAQARDMLRQNQEAQVVASVEKEIKTRIPDFNAQNIIDSLKELHKTDPKKAEYYNGSPAGWEMYHKDVLSNIAVGDEINNGSHSGGSNDFSSTLEKAKGGDKKSVKDALAGSKA